MVLYIDGTDYNSVTYALGDKSGVSVSKKYPIDPHQSHKTLQHLKSFLSKSKILNLPRLMPVKADPKSSISLIIVNKGPGSFTGTRIGIAHAMALGLAWGVKVKAVAIADYSRMTKQK